MITTTTGPHNFSVNPTTSTYPVYPPTLYKDMYKYVTFNRTL
jgi:hypothetical protein